MAAAEKPEETPEKKRPNTQVVASMFADRIAAGGVMPWRSPVDSSKAKLAEDAEAGEAAVGGYAPFWNGTSGHAYTGVNPWLLLAQGVPQGPCVTSRQARVAASENLIKQGYHYIPRAKDWEGARQIRSLKTYRLYQKSHRRAGGRFEWDGEGEAPFGLNPKPGIPSEVFEAAKEAETDAGNLIVFWTFIPKYKNKNTGKPVRKPKGKLPSHIVKDGSFPVLKPFWVFPWELAQCMPEPKPPKTTTRMAFAGSISWHIEAGLDEGFLKDFPEIAGMVQMMIDTTGLKLETGSDVPKYFPTSHKVQMPALDTFPTPEQYAVTLMHELGHASSKPLARDLNNRFGDSAYAMEELVVEIASATLGQMLGLDVPMDETHVSYVKHWAAKVRDDEYAIFTAARKAQEVVDYLFPAVEVDGDEGEGE